MRRCLAGRELTPRPGDVKWAEFVDPCPQPGVETLFIDGRAYGICAWHRELLDESTNGALDEFDPEDN